MPCCAARSAAASPAGTSDPQATSSTSGAAPRRSTSTGPTRSTAGIEASTEPLGKRSTVGPSVTASASRSSSFSVASSRGIAIRSPGTTAQIEVSHMPLCDAPSVPVTPARSSTTVTGWRCSATSISSWSKARLRKVE